MDFPSGIPVAVSTSRKDKKGEKSKMLRRIFSYVWIVVLITQICSLTNGQTTTNPLQDEVDRAEAKAKIAKAKKEELEAKFPAPDADSLKGNTTVSGDLIESRIQAYNAMETISGEIAKTAQSKGVQRLYIFAEDDYAKIVAYKKLIQQLDVINGEYTKCAPGGVGIAGAPVGMLASIFLNWLPLLKTDTSIVGADVAIDDQAVWASLANHLSAKGISLSNPFVSNFDFLTVNAAAVTPLITKLTSAERDSTRPCTNAAYPLKSQVDSAFNKLKKDIGLESGPAALEKKVSTTITTPAPPKTIVEEIVETVPAKPDGPASVTWFDYLVTEQIINTMQANNIYWIKLKNVKAGGNVRVKSNPLIDIFRGGNSIKFSGGAIVYYYILDNSGNIIGSGVVKAYTSYQKSSQIK